MRRKRRGVTGSYQAAEVDLTPLMCLFIILVPLLLLTAVFERLSALKATLPAASTLEATEQSEAEPTGIIELQLLIGEQGLRLQGTTSHDPSGKEKETYEDIQYDIPMQDEAYDFPELQRILLGLKEAYPRQEEILFLVEDRISYDTIVQAMDTCREEHYQEDGKGKRRPLFPTIAISERFDEDKGFEGLREGTRAIDRKLGYR